MFDLSGKLMPRKLPLRVSSTSKTLLFTSALILIPSLGAQAETNKTANAPKEDKLVVVAQAGSGEEDSGFVATNSSTGTKTDTPLIKTPQAISVVTREQMAAQDATSVAQALRYTAGVISEYRGASNLNDEVTIRGFGSVPRFLDGLSYSSIGGVRRAGQIDPWMLERVEVVRGPASVLYGQVNPGGLINMVSKRPTAESIHKVQARVGNNKLAEAAFDFGGALDDEGKVLYRLNGIGRTQDDAVQSFKQERFAIAPAITFLPNEDTSFTLLTSYQREPEAGSRNFLPARGLLTATQYGYIPRDFNVSDPAFDQSWREQTSVGYAFEHYINDTFKFRQNLRYTQIKQHYNYLVFLDMQPDNRTMNRRAQIERQQYGEFSLDNQLQADFWTGELNHTVLTGLDYKRTRIDSQFLMDRGSKYDLDWVSPVYGLNIQESALGVSDDDLNKLDQVGVYLQDQIEYGNWNLLLSGRYDWSQMKALSRVTSKQTQQDDNAFTGRAAVLYAFDSGISPYVSYSTSFEPNTGKGAPGHEALKPITARQVEAGIKYQPPGSQTLLTAALYDLRQKNISQRDQVLNYDIPIGETQSQGLETELKSALSDNIDVIASYTYTTAKVRETTRVGEQGKMPPTIPHHAAALWGMYTFNEGVLSGLSTGAGVRYMGTSWGDRKNTFKVPASTVYDWMMRYELGNAVPTLKGTSLQVNLNNITDKEYVATCSTDSACFYAPGRTATATVSYSW
ncbi:ferrichrysobactin receptor [Yersinia entomophaga]|uniref:Ferrichrysobactin receptor n=1 Tax=Yersinia entomophaga TaxID=935293 RepID=A0ABN4PX29_YERET|nr:TonB-dependent siderophore receptor [Yersinia entomophaga]ANI30102.1 ferrichrysobactin receptor [Yersinia entomophaga]OWF87625.1 TonB-dependent siderophore receptor [Yersinia entomophaga]